MTNGTHTGVLCLVLAAGQVGCDGGGAVSPTAPSSQAQQAATAAEPLVPGHTLRPVALSGVVTEATATGDVPIAGAFLSCDLCGLEGHSGTATAVDGSYRFSGDLAAGGGIWLTGGNQTTIFVSKEGYHDPPGEPEQQGTGRYDGHGRRTVQIDGDTRYDIRLVRQ